MADNEMTESTELTRILIIDDNPAIHEDIRKILCAKDQSDGIMEAEMLFFGDAPEDAPTVCYNIDSAYQGKEGFELVGKSIQDDQPYSLAFVDMRMPPGWDGLETMKHLWQADPALQIVICTAYSDYSWLDIVETFGLSDQILILKKPFDNAEVSQIAAAMTEKRRLLEQARSYTRLLEEQVRQQTRSIRHAHEETIHRLVQASMFRDEETGAHIRRVGLYSAVIAETAQWPEDEVERIRLAAPMHDVGKIGIPDLVLQKPGPLTADERIIIESHTVIGAKILAQSESPMLQMAYEIAMHHHERWDGTGYPSQLQGTDIPTSARIVGIADVYDALTQDRVYRSAFPREKALAMMREGQGSHFDPDLLDMFFERLADIEQIARDNRDLPKAASSSPVVMPAPFADVSIPHQQNDI